MSIFITEMKQLTVLGESLRLDKIVTQFHESAVYLMIKYRSKMTKSKINELAVYIKISFLIYCTK